MRKRHSHDNAHTPFARAKPPGVGSRLWPYATLVAIAVAFCGRAVFTGNALAPLDMLLLMSPWNEYAHRFPEFSHVQTPMLDPVQQYLPWRLFATASLRDGIIPLWNPYAFSGTPFLANLQSAIFYPPNLIFLIMPVALGFTYTAVLHLALAGCFMFFFLRVWGIAKWPALAAAAAYMLNGYFIAWLEYPAIGLWVAVWLPLMLGLHELGLRRRSWALTALTGLVVAVQFFGGHLQVAAYVVFAFLLYALVRTIWNASGESGSSVRRWEPITRGVAALALGLLLAAGQLLPTMELAPRSHRPPVSPAAIQNTALPYTHLVIYFVPKFFGTPADGNYWGNYVGRPDINFFETAGYVGILPLLLACFGALEWRRPLTKYLLALGAISLLLALGTPLYLLFFYAAPGFKQLAGVARILYLTAFAATGLAALGLDRLSREPRAPMVSVAGLFSIIALSIVSAGLWIFRPQVVAFAQTGVEPIASFPRYLLVQVVVFGGLLIVSWILIAARSRLRVTVFGALCLALIVLDLFLAWVRFNPVTDPRMAFFDTGATTFLREHSRDDRMLAIGTSFRDWMPPNTPMAYSLRDIQGSDSLWWGRYHRFLSAAQPGAPTFDWRSLDSPALELLAVRHVISPHPVEHRGWELVLDDDAFVYRRRAPTARARLVSDWRVATDEEALQAVASGAPTMLATPLLDAAPNARAAPGAPPGSAEIVADGIDMVQVRCRAPAPRVLVLADPNYPGWRVEIGDEAAPSLTADYAFRAVEVPRGEHLVTWRYEPGAFRLGLFFGLVGAAAVVACLAAGTAGGEQRRKAAQRSNQSAT
ncbi:MAG: YfhO family protein [Armatimonadota bacterium]|nr:MAG: YfhO family protein [Armatimonadota bacterium]